MPSTNSVNFIEKLSEKDGKSLLDECRRKILIEDSQLSFDELSRLFRLPDSLLGTVTELAHEVRMTKCGDIVEIEGILSAKTGGCPEDCHFCSQSAKHDKTIAPTEFLTDDEILKAAYETKESKATEFCIVLAIRGPNERIMQRLEHLVPLISKQTGLNVAVSAGILSLEQAKRLKDCGTHRYNHNLEAAASFFPSIVTTHTWEERVQTCQYVTSVGMELCCGLIFGMGESNLQRIEALTQIRDLSPNEVPLNFLNPRPGTPLATRSILSAKEALLWIAIARLTLPNVILRYGGGREITLKELQAMGMQSGINALIIGNYLTTLGRPVEEDLEMLDSLKMPVGSLSTII